MHWADNSLSIISILKTEAFKFNEVNYFSTSYMGWALGAFRRNKLDYKRIPLFGCNFDYLTIYVHNRITYIKKLRVKNIKLK